MKKLTIILALSAIAFAPAIFAGDDKCDKDAGCPAAKAACCSGDKAACPADAKAQAKAAKAQAKAAKAQAKAERKAEKSAATRVN